MKAESGMEVADAERELQVRHGSWKCLRRHRGLAAGSCKRGLKLRGLLEGIVSVTFQCH